jgi:hypothetical protein
MKATGSGKPVIVDRSMSLTAPNDSIAYQKALDIYDSKVKLNEGSTKDQFLNFELYNYNDVLVTR